MLISSELGSSFAELEDEAFKVRVINAASEVVASYAVDDHQLEMKVKIPGDWPLHRIEVNEGKRVGVDESRWRRWMFAVQQVVWAQVGVWPFSLLASYRSYVSAEWQNCGCARVIQEERHSAL